MKFKIRIAPHVYRHAQCNGAFQVRRKALADGTPEVSRLFSKARYGTVGEAKIKALRWCRRNVK